MIMHSKEHITFQVVHLPNYLILILMLYFQLKNILRFRLFKNAFYVVKNNIHLSNTYHYFQTYKNGLSNLLFNALLSHNTLYQPILPRPILLTNLKNHNLGFDRAYGWASLFTISLSKA